MTKFSKLNIPSCRYYKLTRYFLADFYLLGETNFSLNDPMNKEHHTVYGQQILKTFRPNAMKRELKTGLSVTFHEFLKFITMTGKFGK